MTNVNINWSIQVYILSFFSRISLSVILFLLCLKIFFFIIIVIIVLNLKEIRTDIWDPPAFACFNCWETTCPGRRFCEVVEKKLCCYNCGHEKVTLRTCPRCSDAQLQYLIQEMQQAPPEPAVDGGNARLAIAE